MAEPGINKSMNEKLLTLYKLNENGVDIYRVSDNVPLGAIPLAHYNDINQLVVMSEPVVGTYSTTLSSDTKYYARTLTNESRARISESSSKAQKGKGNSQYGTRWIHSLKKKKSKKIRATDPLPDGWIEGRKIKFLETENEPSLNQLQNLQELFKNTNKD